MNIISEQNISGKPIDDKARRPVHMARWFSIVALSLLLLVGALVGFNAFRSHMIAQFFANHKPPPIPVTVVQAKSEVI
ncbi:MAG: efflux RND transporter periplasmic adaptor subunit, partial [Bradyrhizobium sp.]